MIDDATAHLLGYSDNDIAEIRRIEELEEIERIEKDRKLEMRIYDCEQGSEKWENIRKGRPTASRFKDFMTPKLKKAENDTSRRYKAELAMEIAGIENPKKFDGNFATDLGNEYESYGLECYATENEYTLTSAGFCYPDDTDMWGFSPDGLVAIHSGGEPVGLVEAKLQFPHVFINTLTQDHEKAAKTYWLQCQAQLWISGFDWCDLFIYSPWIDPSEYLTIQITPDEKAFEAFEEIVPRFASEVRDLAKRLKSNPNPPITGFNFEGAEEVTI